LGSTDIDGGLTILAIIWWSGFFWNLSAGQKFSDFKKINALFLNF